MIHKIVPSLLIFLFLLAPISGQESVRQSFLDGDYWQVLTDISRLQSPSPSQRYMGGISALFLGNNPLAITLLQPLATAQQDFPTSAFWLSLAYLGQGETSQAIAALQQADIPAMPAGTQNIAHSLLAALQNKPRPFSDSASTLIYAKARGTLGDHAQAIELFQGIIHTRGDANIPYALFYQAQNYEDLQRLDEAKSRYRLLVSLYPDSAMAAAGQYALAQMSDAEEKLALLQDVAKSAYPSLERLMARLALGQHALDQGSPDPLHAIAQDLSQEEKRRISYIKAIHLAKTPAGQNEAIALLDQVQTGADALSVAAGYAQAYYLSQQNKFNLVRIKLERTIMNLNEPKWSKEVLLYLISLRQLGLSEETATFIKRLPVEETPQLSWLSYFYLTQGWALRRTGQTNEASSLYTVVGNIASSPQIKNEALYNQALIYIQKKEYVRAEEIFAQVSANLQDSAAPATKEILAMSQAIAAFRANQMEKVARITGQYSKTAQESQRWDILQAAVASNQGQFTQAAKIYSQLAEDPSYTQNHQAQYLAALNTYRAGDSSQAIVLFQQLAAQHTDYRKAAYFYLAKSYELQKNWGQAITAYQASLSETVTPQTKNEDRDAYSSLLMAMLYNNDARLMPTLQDLGQYDRALCDQVSFSLAEEASRRGEHALALALFQEIQEKKFRLASLYGQGINLEALGKKTQALQAYISYLQQEAQSPEAILVSRRIATLADRQQLYTLLFNNHTLTLPTATQAPMLLAWVNLAGKGDKNKVEQALRALPLQDLAELEHSQVNLVEAGFYQRIKDYPRALDSYDTALNLALSPQQYVTARRQRSQIYERQGDITQAVKEFLLIEQTFRAHPDIAAQALYEASLVFSRHHMPSQQNVIKKTLKERYPDTPQAHRI